MLSESIMYSSMPFNLSYAFNFGVILLVTFAFLLITGLLSVNFYSAGLTSSYASVIAFGLSNYLCFFLRIFHNYLANFFFLFMFFHIFKSYFYSY
jgi:quinol-cytochrome oxidoreductase complex cytochrome b subunit